MWNIYIYINGNISSLRNTGLITKVRFRSNLPMVFS